MSPSTKEKIAKVEFSQGTEGTEVHQPPPLTDQEKSKWADLKVDLVLNQR